MIKLENHEVIGWEHAIRGMRNPLNSWNKGDSQWLFCGSNDERVRVQESDETAFFVGPNDKDLMTRLRNSGPDHRKFMRMITVYVDITAPLYW